jgi:hypothetical protein
MRILSDPNVQQTREGTMDSVGSTVMVWTMWCFIFICVVATLWRFLSTGNHRARNRVGYRYGQTRSRRRAVQHRTRREFDSRHSPLSSTRHLVTINDPQPSQSTANIRYRPRRREPSTDPILDTESGLSQLRASTRGLSDFPGLQSSRY